jgi:hypothetical protein
MSNYANVGAVPLSLAVFLATDNYDHDPNTISATALIRPLRQIVLSKRVDATDATVDLVQLVPSRMGSAIHDAIERAWTTNHVNAFKALGYPQKVIDRILINPEPAELKEDSIAIYLEQRAQKQVGNYLVSGKFDFVGEGRVEDFKSTSTYTAINSTNDDKYILQGSIYRWLNPTIITKNEMAIQFIFTDWSAARAKAEESYPKQRIQQRILPLKSIAETEAYIVSKLALVEKYMDLPEENIPLCSDEDLWRSAPVFKYYKNPDKMVRSTKNFDTKQEAYIRLAEEGGKGIVVERPGQVTACKYCPAFSVCSQKDILIAQGDLLM